MKGNADFCSFGVMSLMYRLQKWNEICKICNAYMLLIFLGLQEIRKTGKICKKRKSMRPGAGEPSPGPPLRKLEK